MACHEEEGLTDLGGPGGDLLSRVLRHSTMGAGAFHVRVRDGIGCRFPAIATRSSNIPTPRSPLGDPTSAAAWRSDLGVDEVLVLFWFVYALCVWTYWMCRQCR